MSEFVNSVTISLIEYQELKASIKRNDDWRESTARALKRLFGITIDELQKKASEAEEREFMFSRPIR